MLDLKYRPQKLEELVGQDHIVKIVSGMVEKYKETGDLPSCILLGGGHGRGKTSTARLIGKLINCSNYSACGECPSCKEFANGSNRSVIEKDAGATGGVDEIRSLQEDLKFATPYRKKVIIIDEAHGITAAGSKAFLKTLEETKDGLFILCTTETDQIIDTIRSRSIQLLVGGIPSKDIFKRLVEVCKAERIKITKDALILIADMANGHMRDAMKLLDTCSYQANGEAIKKSGVLECKGYLSTDYPENVIKAFISKDISNLYPLLMDCEYDPVKVVDTCMLLLDSEKRAIAEGDTTKRKFPNFDILDLTDLYSVFRFSRRNFSMQAYSIFNLAPYFVCYKNKDWGAITRI